MRKTFLTFVPAFVMLAVSTQDANFEMGLAESTVSVKASNFEQAYTTQESQSDICNSEVQAVSIMNSEDLYQAFTKRVVKELSNALQIFF